MVESSPDPHERTHREDDVGVSHLGDQLVGAVLEEPGRLEGPVRDSPSS